MALRAVIFDFGLVLSGPADATCHATLRRITGLEHTEFERLYWAQPDRRAYDTGGMTGLEYWERFAQQINLSATQEKIAELCLLDAQMWTTENPPMIAWRQQLQEHGVKTALLSNMGDAIAANIQKNFAWVHHFDAQLWSFQLKLGKPDPASYLNALNLLGTKPEETLFIDDRPANLAPAQALGLHTHRFTNVEALRLDLMAHAAAWTLPLPN